MNSLKRYMDAHGLTPTEMAKRVDLSRSYLTEISQGDKLPGRAAMEKLERATAGEVPAASWFSFAAPGDAA